MASFTKQIVVRQWIKRSLREAAWAPLIVFVIHLVALGVYDGYTLLPSLDVIMHFIGGLAMSYLFHRTSTNASRMGIIGPHHQLTHPILVFTTTCTVAVFWEFAEFSLDATFGTRSQAGLVDTMSDLFFGVLGGGSFILLRVVTNGNSYRVRSYGSGNRERQESRFR
jgi:hypothetical protein